MIYGYARVSTEAQDLTSQLAQLKGAGCEKVFREKITGTTAADIQPGFGHGPSVRATKRLLQGQGVDAPPDASAFVSGQPIPRALSVATSKAPDCGRPASR